MRVLLVSPDRAYDQVCGDDVVTRLLLDHAPDGVSYDAYQAALRAGRIRRARPLAAWLASLIMHSRPPAGVAYRWGALPPWRYRLWGKLTPDRPDEDVQWLAVPPTAGYDLVHAFSHPVAFDGPRPPVVLHTGTANSDRLLNYYGYAPALAARVARRDARLLARLGVLHDLYHASEAAAVVVPSRYAWDLHLAGGVPEAKLRLIRFGFAAPAAAHAPSPVPAPGVCRFTLVGHQFWRKGGRALVAAFDRLRRLHPEARLTIVSAVAPAELGVPLDGITVVPGLPREAVYREVYPTTDVYLLPSKAEGYGMSVVEAMSFGLPVIASAISSLPELVADGESGLLVPPDDADALFDAMRRLMEDPGLRARMGAAGRARFAAEHDAQVTRRQWGALYAEAAGRA